MPRRRSRGGRTAFSSIIDGYEDALFNREALTMARATAKLAEEQWRDAVFRNITTQSTLPDRVGAVNAASRRVIAESGMAIDDAGFNRMRIGNEAQAYQRNQPLIQSQFDQGYQAGVANARTDRARAVAQANAYEQNIGAVEGAYSSGIQTQAAQGDSGLVQARTIQDSLNRNRDRLGNIVDNTLQSREAEGRIINQRIQAMSPQADPGLTINQVPTLGMGPQADPGVTVSQAVAVDPVAQPRVFNPGALKSGSFWATPENTAPVKQVDAEGNIWIVYPDGTRELYKGN